MVDDLRSDYDSAWKEALTVYFEPFMAFCFADAHADINWERGYETLDTELQEVIRDAEIGRRLADKLVKVWLNSGEDALVLIHVEIQGQVQTDFAERMYVYNHRLFDRYRQKVFSFAVLGDENSNWRPTSYSYHLPDALIQRINSGNDIELLKQLLVSAVTINSVEEFGQMLTEIQWE